MDKLILILITVLSLQNNFCIELQALYQNEATNRCSNYYNEPGVCVSRHLCKHLPGVNLEGRRTFWDLLIMDGHYCGGSREFVCCDKSNVKADKRRDAFEANRDLLPVPGENKCGLYFSDRIARQGNLASIEEFPWMALLQYSYKSEPHQLRPLCSGVLINDRYVMIAAHCVSNLPTFGLTLKTVRLGEWNTSTSPDCLTRGITKECADPEQNINVEKVIIHPDYVRHAEPEKDIALIRLSSPAQMSYYVKPICLPLSGEDTKNVNKRYTVVGWKNGESQVKLTADVNGVNNNVCNLIYGSTNSEATSICATGRANTSFTDNGGVLQATHNDGKGNNYFYAAGVLSYINNRLDLSEKIDNVPNVFTKVSNFVEWIQENIEI